MATIGLIVPSLTYRAEAFLDAARHIGVDVVTISDTRQAFAEIMGDRFLEVALEDPVAAADKITAFAQRVPLDAIVAVDDGGSLVAAIAASRLGLVHNDPDAVAATRDKARMRELLSNAAVSQPAYEIVHVDDDDLLEGEVARHASVLGYPVVIKPSSLSASRGVIRVDEENVVRDVARRVRDIAIAAGEPRSAPMLLEAFIDGDEVAFEGRLRAGLLQRLAIFDKPDPLNGPYFEETIYVTPSSLPVAVQDAVETTVAQACGAIGLTEGPVHAEVRIRPGVGDAREVIFLEVASRTIGGRCAKAIRFANGETLEELVLNDALRIEAPPVLREEQASGVMMLPIRRAGRLVAVRNQEVAAAIAHIDGIEITMAPGRIVRPLPDADRYLGFIFASAPNPDLVVAALRAAERELDVDIADIDEMNLVSR